MSASSGSRDYGRFDELAEEFAERYRQGERPSLQDYINRLPEMADEIREMFPAPAGILKVGGKFVQKGGIRGREGKREAGTGVLPCRPHR